jgi:arylsulfatase A-like enzyme
MDIMPTIVDLLELPEESLLAVHDGESIAALFDGNTPQRTHSIPFRFQKNAALIDGDYKLLGTSGRRGADWQLYDLKKDPGETKDLSQDDPKRFARMKSEAEGMLRSVESSAAGGDYPEGKVIQAPRSAFWRDMAEYKPYLEIFSRRSSKKKKPE